jgi:hypothetical protein
VDTEGGGCAGAGAGGPRREEERYDLVCQCEVGWREGSDGDEGEGVVCVSAYVMVRVVVGLKDVGSVMAPERG